jgi:hypothetical protein
MFDKLKQAWREAVENFHHELNAEEGMDTASGLDRELNDARKEVQRLEAELHATQRKLDTERQEEQVCRRREQLARQIGDLETVRVAVEFAARHRERGDVLARKLEALQAEHALRVRELAELTELASRRRLDPQGTIGQSGPGAPPRDSADSEAFQRLEREARERAATERLEELKRKMR